jgi:hypothetical protein
MTSKAEVFCRDRRLYDVKRGVVYLRRTEDLAQRQWRHYGTVPSIKTHVIRDIGVTAPLYDVTPSSPVADVSDLSTETITDVGKGSDSDVNDVVPTSPIDVKGEDVTALVVEDEPSQATHRTERRLRYLSSTPPQFSLTFTVQRPNPNAPCNVGGKSTQCFISYRRLQ